MLSAAAMFAALMFGTAAAVDSALGAASVAEPVSTMMGL
jgi:hypothetical protein